MYGVSQKFENYFKLGGHATSLEIMNKMKLFVDFVWKESEGQRETETQKKKNEQFHLNISIQMEREGSSNAIELCHIIVVVIQ